MTLVEKDNTILNREFLDGDFLLYSKTAKMLFEKYARNAPIVDFHCHISPAEVAEDKKFRNITELWLGGDHYKWRALRGNGVAEEFITGCAPNKEKFLKWAETMPLLIGNPLYHWSHLELRRYFGINEILGPDTAELIWDKCNEKLKAADFSARSLITRSNVSVLCTTDDPADSLQHHIALAKDQSFAPRMLPTFRPDRALYIEREGFSQWLEKLSSAVGRNINSLADLLDALSERIKLFSEAGCRLSDHSLEPVVFEACTLREAEAIYSKSSDGASLNDFEARQYRTFMLLYLAGEYTKQGWTMQLHMLAQRNNNSRKYKSIGPDSGFDTMSDELIIRPLARLLDAMEASYTLPETILYSLNGKDLEALGALAGCFFDGSVAGKIQLGSAWWFNDTKDGMERQLKAFGNLGLLGKFIGMLTDSRSLVSYPRHEYFRRILCNLIGDWAEKGEIPRDEGALGKIITDICHKNAEAFLGI